MSHITFSIDQEILNRYPATRIGYLGARRLAALKSAVLPADVVTLPQRTISDCGMTIENVSDNATIKAWREIYADCGVRPKTYKSSVEALLRRFIKGEYRPIHAAVDLYNHISAAFVLPMGGYNLAALSDQLTLRYARLTDQFVPLNGEVPTVTPEQVVYADAQGIVCWLWNHKDSMRSMLNTDTESGLFIVDSTRPEESTRLSEALTLLDESLRALGAEPFVTGTLDRSQMSAEID